MRTPSEVASHDLARIDDDLKNPRDVLAALPAPAGDPSPTNGWHSAVSATPDVEKWVQVDLGKSLPLDEIRLIPARPTDFPDTPGFGFPVRFRVDVSDDATFAKRLTVADHTGDDFANPGDEPFAVR